MATTADVVLVIGSNNSSNSNRLKDIAFQSGCSSILINSKEEIDLNWISQFKVVGITAGASAPEHLVQELVIFLQNNFNNRLFVSNYR